MSFFRYLKDNIRFIGLYFFMALFFMGMSLLDGAERMQPENAFYSGVVSFVCFAVCVGIDYAIRNRQAKRLKEMTCTQEHVPVLPEPAGYRDELYQQFIQGLYADYTELGRALEEEYREDREFMIAWVHEVKTPITAARLLLEQGNTDVASLAEELERIAECVEKVLYYSRSDSFSHDYIIAEEPLARLVKEDVKKHAALFIKKKIRIEIGIPPEYTVYTDRKWLIFIIDQLLSNALKYTGEGGEIRIWAERNVAETLLFVADNGKGIKKQDIGRVFAKSFTGQNGRNPGSAATGLGLYLAQKLAIKLNHSLTIDSEFGTGTTVTVHFPILDDSLTKM